MQSIFCSKYLALVQLVVWTFSSSCLVSGEKDQVLMIIFVMLNRSVFIIIPQQQDVPYKIHYLYHVLTSNDKKANYAKSPKKRHLSQQVQTSLVYTTSTSFILAYSLITIEANSTNGFLTIFQMIKELNKEPVICINGLWL